MSTERYEAMPARQAPLPVAITTTCDTTRRLSLALQYVASRKTYGKRCSARPRSRNAPTSVWRSAQIRETSLLVERAPAFRKASDHSVDLFAPVMTIVSELALPRTSARTPPGSARVVIDREGHARPARVDLRQIMSAVSDSHAEIMRDELSPALHNGSRYDLEYLFGGSITS